MKKDFVRRILVGIIALTTVFSSVGTAVSFAADGEETIVSEMTAPEEALDESLEETPEEASIFEPFTEEELHTEEAVAESAVSEETSEEVVESEVATESDTETIERSYTEVAEAVEGDTAYVEETLDASAEGSSEEILEVIAATEATSEETRLTEAPAQAEIPDLSDTSFAKVTNVVPESISDVSKEFTIGFDFYIYNAQRIPNGEFTYKLPENLDFSSAEGNEIVVYESGAKIGVAEVDSDNVMHFHIDPAVLVQKPNGLSGSVRLGCQFDSGLAGDETEVVVEFYNGERVTIAVEKPVITASKDPVKISNGTAWFKVKFEVSADAENFVITDELGSNLEFTGSYSFASATKTIKARFEQESPQKLVVYVGNIAAGTYTLRYQVRAIGDYDTTGMTVEEKKASANSNKASWIWEGSNTHEVYSYADQTQSHWLSKYGANMSNPGEVAPDGTAKWQVYLNGGSVAYDLTGYTFIDELDPNMEYIKDSFEVKYSTDRKTWKDMPALKDLIVFDEENGNNRYMISFTEDIPVGYYRIFYSTKIKGKLPTTKTKYYNTASLYKEGLVDTKTASNAYNFSGTYASEINKGILEERNTEGFVSWKTVFSVAGDKNTYKVTIKDTIDANEDCKVIAGKVVGADIVKDSEIRLVKIEDDGAQEIPVNDYTVTFDEDNTFTLVANKLSSGIYAIYYKTQDYIGEKSEHNFPSGSSVTITNNASLKIDKTVIEADPVSYEISTDGLPMMKKALNGSYDSEVGEYVIPWEVSVNKNELGQSISLAAGSQMTVTDKLPEGLEYVTGSAVIKKADEENGVSLEPTVTTENGRQTLVWTSTWNADYYVISFKTRVADSYLKKLIAKGGSGSFAFSFENEAQAQVGNTNGMTNAGSQDTITLLKKVGTLNEATGLLEYSVLVNESGVDLFPDLTEVELTDELSSGRYVVGSLKVYDYTKYDENAQDNSAAVFEVDDDKISATADGRSFALKLPDNKPFLVKYSVIPDVTKGEDAGNGKVTVTVENKAALVGKGVITSDHNATYTIKNVHADITSNKGMIKITKVSTGNDLVGLTGAVFKLVRVDVQTGVETEISRATSDKDGIVKFERDGDFDSLIFDALYYYQEVSAPKGYKLDSTKHYIVFKGQNYDSRIGDIKKFLGDTAFVEYDINASETGATFETTVENESIPKKPEDPDDPKKDDVVTVTTTTDVIDDEVVTLLDLPQVLGASRNPEDLPEVLGARRADTGDRSMAGAYFGLFASFIALGFVLTKRNKESNIE